MKKDVTVMVNGRAVTYLARLSVVVPAGRVLVHNHVIATPAPRRLGVRGFRAWLESPDPARLVVCGCEWAPELGRHYRVRGKGALARSRMKPREPLSPEQEAPFVEFYGRRLPVDVRAALERANGGGLLDEPGSGVILGLLQSALQVAFKAAVWRTDGREYERRFLREIESLSLDVRQLVGEEQHAALVKALKHRKVGQPRSGVGRSEPHARRLAALVGRDDADVLMRGVLSRVEALLKRPYRFAPAE